MNLKNISQLRALANDKNEREFLDKLSYIELLKFSFLIFLGLPFKEAKKEYPNVVLFSCNEKKTIELLINFLTEYKNVADSFFNTNNLYLVDNTLFFYKKEGDK